MRFPGGPGETGDGPPLTGIELTEAISAALVALYGEYLRPRPHHGHHLHQRQRGRLHLGDILTTGESLQIADGGGSEVIDGRIAFQEGAQDEFTAAIDG